MNSGGWVIDENDEAMFIDIDQEQKGDRKDVEYSEWCNLPDLLLEQIFSYLSIKERYYASCVCQNWNRIFYLPYVWRQFILDDLTLTRSKFNYYLGWQYVLDHLRTSLCLQTVGRNIKNLIIKPMLNFSNLYEFINILSWYIEQQVLEANSSNKVANNSSNNNKGIGIGNNILRLKFTFPCDMENNDEEHHDERVRLFGTGGKLLEGLKRLMKNLSKLQILELTDLMLEPNEAQFLLDEVCQECCLNLKKLSIINCTKTPYQILHVGVFLNLFELKISPQNLGNDLVELLGFTHLKHLHIVQNRYTIEEGFIKPIMPIIWRKVRTQNPNLNVHLEVESKQFKSIIWQESAPVRTVVYDSPLIGIKADDLLQAIDLFKDDLRTYGHLNIPKFEQGKLFSDRNDENLVLLLRCCQYLSTLIVTEKVSSSTILLLAYTGRNLKWLHVRRNAVILKCDWPKSLEWTKEFHQWLKLNSKSLESVEKEVSQILGYRWNLLNDKNFKNLVVDLHDY